MRKNVRLSAQTANTAKLSTWREWGFQIESDREPCLEKPFARLGTNDRCDDTGSVSLPGFTTGLRAACGRPIQPCPPVHSRPLAEGWLDSYGLAAVC